MSYKSGIHYERSDAEMTNQELSWNRPDKAFFASGACHILAFTAKELLGDQLKIIFIKPTQEFGSFGTHVYLSDGVWVFDFNGWTKESELLEVTEKEHRAIKPNWSYQRVEITDDLETFCRANKHRLPQDFTHDPIPRAKQYLSQFDLG